MRNRLGLVLFVVGLISGISLGWLLYHPRAPRLDPPAPAIRQADGSLVLERRPDPTAKPAHAIPRGSVLERKISVEVAPRVVAPPGKDGYSSLGSDSVAPGNCPPVDLDLSLVRMPDDSRRVIASSSNGTIVGGLDLPVAPAPIFRQRRWSVQALRGYDFTRPRASWGGSLSYSRGILTGSAGVVGSTAFVGLGLRF